MPDPHVIRLHGPWQFALRQDGAPLSATEDFTGLLTIPGELGDRIPPGFCGRILLSRSFHCPTGLAASQRVQLVLQSATAPAAVTLNDRLLGEIDHLNQTAAFEVRPILRELNRLNVEMEYPPLKSPNEGASPSVPVGITGAVQLMIHVPHE